MAKKKRKSKNYDVTGVVEVINITPGRRRTEILDLDNPVVIENMQISGSIVTKRAIYETSVTEYSTKKKVSCDRSDDEG